MSSDQAKSDHADAWIVDPMLHQVEIGMALQRVLSHDLIRKSPKLQAFLTFAVSETLAGREARLKAYSIAVAALGKPVKFDPGSDPIVRVEASRLRRFLKIYYGSDGQNDPIRITMPTGTYQPVFEKQSVKTRDLRWSDTELDQDAAGDDRDGSRIPTPDDIMTAPRGLWNDLLRRMTPQFQRVILFTNTLMMIFAIVVGIKVLVQIDDVKDRMDRFQKYWDLHLAARVN